MSIQVVNVPVEKATKDIIQELTANCFWIKAMHDAWYMSDYTWRFTSWHGLPCLKCPLDLWVYQDLIYHTKPDYIIETGTGAGGSALFYADMCELNKHGNVITVDVQFNDDFLKVRHPRLQYYLGSSTADNIFATIQRITQHSRSTLVTLDSDHSTAHVLRELELYSTLPNVSYLVVEDTHEPATLAAVREFMQDHPEWAHDYICQRYWLTFNPDGWLRKVK